MAVLRAKIVARAQEIVAKRPESYYYYNQFSKNIIKGNVQEKSNFFI